MLIRSELLFERKMSHHSDLTVQCTTPLQACRNPGMLDYRILGRSPIFFHIFWSYDNVCCIFTWFVCKYDQNCLQMTHLAGILDSSIPGVLQACCQMITITWKFFPTATVSAFRHRMFKSYRMKSLFTANLIFLFKQAECHLLVVWGDL